MKPTARSISREQFRARLKGDPSYRDWIALEMLNRQTSDERAEKKSKWENYRGFSKPDAYVLTPIAEKLLAGKRLSMKDQRLLVDRLPKYHEQFLEPKFAEPPAQKKGPGRTNSGASDSERRAA
jgi:hypothetical protein